tara:strand:+ start:241 stop:423 length:183 start_codon:yes stop_codon:yes gene_type:complete
MQVVLAAQTFMQNESRGLFMKRDNCSSFLARIRKKEQKLKFQNNSLNFNVLYNNQFNSFT